MMSGLFPPPGITHQSDPTGGRYRGLGATSTPQERLDAAIAKCEKSLPDPNQRNQCISAELDSWCKAFPDSVQCRQHADRKCAGISAAVPREACYRGLQPATGGKTGGNTGGNTGGTTGGGGRGCPENISTNAHHYCGTHGIEPCSKECVDWARECGHTFDNKRWAGCALIPEWANVPHGGNVPAGHGAASLFGGGESTIFGLSPMALALVAGGGILVIALLARRG